MAITHNFTSSNSIGGIGEAIFFKLLSELGEVKSVVSDRAWQKKGIDFILDGVYYDVKFDTKANATGNLALETVSRRKDGEVLKSGWAHTSQADCISYMYLQNTEWSLYFFTPEEIRSLVENESYGTKVVKNYGYESEVVLIPIEDLSHKLNMVFPVVGLVDTSILKKVHGYLKENKE